jgi:hypothetical protein
MKKRMMTVVGVAALMLIGANVRADAPSGHFTDLGDGTVRDNATGLVWQQTFSPSTQSQAASVDYCTRLTVPRGGGWRLPTVAELQTIVDETRSDPAIDSSYFPRTPSERFWSATPLAGQPPSYGWSVAFSCGFAGFSDVPDDVARARCVR